MRRYLSPFLLLGRTALLYCSAVFLPLEAFAATAGKPVAEALSIASDGKSDALIVRAPNAGPFVRRATSDLSKYIELMTGAKIAVVDTPQAIETALASPRPLLIIGDAALAEKPDLWTTLSPVLKKNPYLRTDGIVLRRHANRVYAAGNNDKSHYFAVAELLRAWGVRWFMPGEFGECVPEEKELTVGELNYAHSSPFEIRTYGVSWLGETAGAEDFKARNMMAGAEDLPSGGHALGKYTKGLAKTPFEISLTDPETAQRVAQQTEKLYKDSKHFSLGMEDGAYTSTYPRDLELMSLQWDKYMLRWSVTDAMLELYNNVLRILRERHPDSSSKVGFLAYSNMFLPPVREFALDPSLYAWLAPIDIDPIHAMDDPRSPQRQEYQTILEKWTKLMEGRVAIYDYDQGMLVWRDLPNPSHQAFRHDVKRYRDLGILGFYTESRNAIATTFINLYMRGRLMWNPEEDADLLLADFYERFFGPAAKPMKKYWDMIFDAWTNTIATEHEFFLAPAIYTPDLVRRLGVELREAERIIKTSTPPGQSPSRNEQLYARRVDFVRLGYDVLNSYMTMVKASASDVDYSAAVAAGERGLQARDALTAMDKTFTTTRFEKGNAFWPGEVQQYRDLLAFTNGEKGALLAKLPLEWIFHRDPDRKGEERGFIDGRVDLAFWTEHGKEFDPDTRRNYPPDQWERIRVDLYPQAQGVRNPDRQNFTGDMWYRLDVDLSAEQAGAVPHIRFPGLFGPCELFINGVEAGRRKQDSLWWRNDYRFEWDAPLKDKVRAGKNVITLRCHSEHHVAGMFRRPFIYAPIKSDEISE